MNKTAKYVQCTILRLYFAATAAKAVITITREVVHDTRPTRCQKRNFARDQRIHHVGHCADLFQSTWRRIRAGNP
ncbi:Uncharacterised protein [Vibrio cholerae]|uniref:Secreted protein n=1 Tax=Vibrio cholerae TaxID=666 RepID=A0A655YT71_VIBCL|nr:Uncharacterised protein [Vibrio cholerae]